MRGRCDIEVPARRKKVQRTCRVDFQLILQLDNPDHADFLADIFDPVRLHGLAHTHGSLTVHLGDNASGAIEVGQTELAIRLVQRHLVGGMRMEFVLLPWLLGCLDNPPLHVLCYDFVDLRRGDRRRRRVLSQGGCEA